jgi:putative lipoic acid-binding regulatory protein
MKNGITFKAMFRNSGFVSDTVRVCIAEKIDAYHISEKPSANGKFISFTVTLPAEADDLVDGLTASLSSIEGFMMMI